ncbi:phage tail protein [Mannheimia haemolytica]|uniref:phage tail protein n=1 Tax=Mannheimia haemolytica TaxID=75985 RepID=UPI001E54DA10|nr:phage tail protein [Mannheimia haemolytica]UFK42030.1 phage tail protein [Mannheimia haemolytica]
MRIYGAKGGGGGHTPIEAPETGRSKQIVNIVELLCEGEIEGLVDGFKSIYLDGTKIQNDDDSYNFNNVSGQLNVGTQDQEVLEGYDSSQNEVSVGVEVKKKNGAIVRTVTDERISRLRLTLGVRSLFHQNNQGDTNTTNVDLKITIGTRQYSHSFNGKYSSQYLESVVFDNLPPVPFNISVERLTEDSNSQRLQNGTIWSSYTEIIDTEFTYPNSAVAGISFDSEYFNNIPTRNYLIKAKKVKVPSNYDPVKRTYTGFWDGTFKIAWTNNPAWEIYDLAPILSKMLGVEISFDKWALYDVARYCDQLVPDGMGGMEPRFVCNVWLTEVKTAYDLLNDFCSVFRAIPIWTGTEVSVIIDRPRDPVWTYTNANVVGGFERSYSARKSRHNAVQVTYSDKTNGYESAIEYVSDDEEIKKHGLNLSQVTAFGCTSRGQAYRTGKWILETEKREKETITFTVGREGLMHLPGDIIRVADSHYAGTEIGGRVLAINGRKVTLDREISIDNASYFTYINGEATHSSIKIQSVNGKEITLDSTPTGLETYGVWSLSTKQISSGLYRSISIVENADGTNTITALQHEPQKEAIVDNAAHFVETARTLYKAPQINAVEVSTGYDGKLYISSDISSGDGKLTYDLKITKDGNLYQFKKGLVDPNIELSDLPNGDYSVIIYGKNAKGQIVTEKTQTFTIDRPPAPTGVVVTGGLGQITLEWDWVNEVTQTEIFAAETDNFALAKKIAKVTARTYAHTLKGNKVVRYYWLRHTRGINVGPFYQQQGVRGQTAVDLDARLTELNTQLSRNIVNEVFDVAAPARGLELVKTVANLTDKGTKLASSQVYNQADGKLYTWNGTAYSATVAAEDVTGKLSKSKIDTSLISQLTGADNTANLARRLAETAQSNINQEITNRQDAVTAEANNRTKAIQAESANLTKKIQAEATARGAAVTQLQNVDAQQAQLISAVTAKANNALSGLEEEKTARANGDKAESQAREVLTSRVASAESGIAEVRQSIATANSSIAEVSQNLNAKIDGLSVGGRNLLLKSNATNLINFVRSSQDVLDNTDFKTPVVRINCIQDSWFGRKTAITSGKLLAGKYTLSFKYRTNATINNTFIGYGGNQRRRLITSTVVGNETWQTCKLTFETTEDYPDIFIIIGGYGKADVSYIEFAELKLEKGAIATDWTPAPEDVESSVSAVSADLTSYKQTQASADLAQSQQITGLTTRMAGAEGNITEIKSTKANKNEVAGLAQNSLQAIWKADVQSAVNGFKVGGRNYLKGSRVDEGFWFYTKSGSSTGSSRIDNKQLVWLPDTDQANKWKQWQQTGYDVRGIKSNLALNDINVSDNVVISFFAKNESKTNQELQVILTQDVTSGNRADLSNHIITLPAQSDKTRYVINLKILKQKPALYKGNRLILSVRTPIPDGAVYVDMLKLEKGTIATDWTPAPEDVESSVSAVSAKVDSVQQTLANADSALSSRIDTVNASVGSNSSKITQVSNAVASVDGKLSATHTIKTETIAGGRKAIAGIAFGATADNRNAESSVIVMADKFEVVKNAQDGTPVRLFGVVENKVAINGNLIATGSISGDHINANSVRTAVLTAGAIKTEHLAAGQISADKLAIGLGGNLLVNPIFATPDLSIAPFGWNYWRGEVGDRLNIDTRNIFNRNEQDNYGLKNGGLPNELVFSMRYSTTEETSDTGRIGWLSQDINVVPNKKYIASVWLACHRGQAKLVIENIEKPGGAYLGWIGDSEVITGYSANQGEFKNMKRVKVVFTAPTSGCIRFALRLDNIQGKANPFLFARRPMLEEASDNVTDITQPSPWQNAGVTAIHGGSIATNTVTAQQIAANTITANEIAAGTIAARNMAANSINASHIVGSSITADKLNVNNLAAISANLGKVTAGTITGTTITGNTISGGSINGTTISGTTISGGTIKGARLEGATGKFTGELEVSQLIGGGVIEQVTGKLKYSHRNRIYEGQEHGENSSSPIYRHEYIYKATVTINAAPTRRYIEIIGSESFILEANQSITKTIEKSLNRNASGSSLDVEDQT